jgi:phosphoglycolate phosphatase
MLLRIKHVIWDWNGTLLDDAWLCVLVVNQLLEARGLPALSMAQYQEMFDFPVKDYYLRIGFDSSREPYEHLALEFIEAYERRRLQCRLQPHARKAIQLLRARGIEQSVLSAYRQSSLQELIVHYGLEGLFTHVVGVEDQFAHGKLDLGRGLADQLGPDKIGIVLIGDTTHDFKVATAMGIACMLVPSGHQSRSRLETCGTRVLDSLRDLAGVVDQQGR